MYLTRLIQMNESVNNYFSKSELYHINAMILNYKNLIEEDNAYEADDYISELFLKLLELIRNGQAEKIKSKAAFYHTILHRAMINQYRKTAARKRLEDTVSCIFKGSCSRNNSSLSLSEFVEYLLKNGDDESFCLLLATTMSIFNDDDSKTDRLNCASVARKLSIHYLEYRRQLDRLRRSYERGIRS